VLGAANGTLDVSMHAHALSVERRYQRPIMSSFHAFFSLGGAAGAALAGIAMWLGVGDTTHVAIAVAATGFAAFSLAMTAGRLAGDRVVGRLGAVRALRVSGGLPATGLGAALLIGGPIAGIVGFGLVGAGIANIIPVLFSSTGHAGGGAAGSALAAVATPGYLGFLAGPMLIGLAAEHLGLRGALGLVCVALRPRRGGRAQTPPKEFRSLEHRERFKNLTHDSRIPERPPTVAMPEAMNHVDHSVFDDLAGRHRGGAAGLANPCRPAARPRRRPAGGYPRRDQSAAPRRVPSGRRGRAEDPLASRTNRPSDARGLRGPDRRRVA
jgi:hypothetical protein